MTVAVRISMVLVVLANLAFVSITEAARWTWLGPLFLLTLASPWLVRLARHAAYRWAWNLSLLGVFALLLQHGFSAGVQYLLEDGLLLAALCQVHLLNNLRNEQKPDLLFFNSFLIAVVTSFLSIDVEYFVLFVVYAPLLVLAMQVLSLKNTGIRAAPRYLRATLLRGLLRAGVVLALTMPVFALWPRDFSRRGLIGERLRMKAGSGRGGEVDFTEQVNLDRSGDVRTSDRVVMVVRGDRVRIPTHWRGATLDGFDGQQWRPSRGYWYAGLDPWRMRGDGSWTRRTGASMASLEVKLLSGMKRRLFLPLASRRVEIKPPAHTLRLQTLPDLTFWHPRYPRPIEYSVQLRDAVSLGGPVPSSLPGLLLPYTFVQHSAVPRETFRIVREIRASLRPDVPQHVFVEAVRRALSTRYGYLPPGADQGARTLSQFIDGAAAAHCEYFATALVVMLRSQGVPCRYVSGYRSDEWDPIARTLTIRALHAHAWVEVLDPSGGWYTVDASPVVDIGAVAAGGGLFARMRRLAEGVWAKITGFDEGARARAWRWLKRLPARMAVLGLVLLGAGLILFLSRRRREPRAVRAYRAALRKHGLQLAGGETPRRLLARAPQLEAATRAHERERYVS